MEKNIYKKWLTDYRVYLFILVVLKLYNINIEVLDEHNWRQTLTLGVARNFIEWDANILFPRTPICDSRTGIIPQEFPILNYLIAGGWKVFGYHNWVFRCIMIFVTSFGLYWFYKFLEQAYTKNTALAGLLIFGTSIGFAYSRKAMPDMFSISLCLGAVWYASLFLRKGNPWHLLWYILLSTFGLLSKMPAAIVMVFVLIPFLDPKIDIKKKVHLSIASSIPLLSLAYWYFAWVPHLEDTYNFKLYYTRSFSEGLLEIINLSDKTYQRFNPILFKNPLTFYFSVAGLLLMIWKKSWKNCFMILCALSIALVFIAKTGKVFSNHEYYILPLAPFMSLLAAYAYQYALEKYKIFWLILALSCLYSLEDQWNHMSIKKELAHFATLQSIVPKYVPEGSRIVVNGQSGNPMPLYMSQRNGWLSEDKYLDTLWLAGEKTVGLDYMLIIKDRLPPGTIYKGLLYEDDHFAIYKNEYVKN